MTLVAFAALAASNTTARAAACGDLTDSAGVNVGDVVLLFRAVLENPDPTPLCGGAGAIDCGDVNADGAISISDVVILFNSVLGNETLYPLCVGEGPTLAGCPGTVTISSNITSNQVWPAGCTIILDGTIFVDPGVVLKIEAGATIFGDATPANPPPTALVFRRDSKINAQGTEASPIVFTSDKAVGTRAPGDWAGVALNGRGPVNCPGGECDAEGLVNVPFGGGETNDSSGIARFLRVEFAGRELSPDNELNVWTMNALGRGTTIDHIHAHMGLDDGHEWFGGTVNSKYMLSSGAADDQLDWQLGYTGALQYGVGIQIGSNLDTSGSRGFEGDNNGDGNDLLPRSDPKFCNVTLMGAKSQAGGDVDARCMRIREGTAGQIWKTICFNWNTGGIRVSDSATFDVACEPNGTNSLSGDLMVQRSILYDVGDDAAVGTEFCRDSATGTCSTTRDLCDLWAATGADALIEGVDPGMPAGCGTTVGCMPVPSNAVVNDNYDCSNIDPFFEPTSYIGAFDPSGDADGWANAPWVAFPLN